MSLLQIISTPFTTPSLAILLFKRPATGIPSRLSRPPILYNNDDNNFTSLINRQHQVNEDINTHKNIPFISTGTNVVLKQEDGRPWMHRTVTGHKSEDHNGRSYKITVTKIRFKTGRPKGHVKAAQISAEHYLRNRMSKTI